jgi:hypothetical protein
MSDFYQDDDGQTEVQQYKPGTVAVEESRVMSEVKAQVFMARQYPRDVIKARDRIMGECSRLKLAEKAIYSFPRSSTQITGPSIRLAEALARSWGNVDCGIIEGERTDGESSMIAYAWDLETNLRIRKEFKVQHVRDTRQGRKKLTDERDIYEMTANQGSRRLRACILQLIPGDIVDEAVKACEKTLVAKVGDLATVLPKMVDTFASLGVTREMLEKRLRHRIDATQPAEVVQLGSIFNSIRDGMATVADFFEPVNVTPENIVKAAADTTGKKPDAPSAKPAKAVPEIVAIKDSLITWLESDIPAAMKQEISEVMSKSGNDVAKLAELLNKINTAVK